MDFFNHLVTMASEPQTWVALITLAALEIVLGIDNIIFISIVTNKLPEAQRPRARFIGLAGAMSTRILLLCSLAYLARATEPLFTIPYFNHPISTRDLVLIIGGLFLLWKSTKEIFEHVEAPQHNHDDEKSAAGSVAKVTFASAIIQVTIMDIIFSLDSVITAVGMTNNIPVMIGGIVIAIIVMMLFSGAVSDFVSKHPSMTVLALSFLIMIGGMLVAEGFGAHVEKNFVYFAMGFSVIVEFLNIRRGRGHN